MSEKKLTTEDMRLFLELEQFDSEYMASRNFAQNTRKSYKQDVRGFIGYLVAAGLKKWEELELKHLQGYMAELDRQDYADSSRQRKAVAIQTFIKFLLMREVIQTDPTIHFQIPKVSRKEPRFLSEEEYNALLAQITNSRDRAIVMTFLQVGLRVQELVNLTIYDIEIPKKLTKSPEDVGTARIRRKGGEVQMLYLNWKACEALKAYLRERERIVKIKATTTQKIFLNKYGQGMSVRAVQRCVDKYLEQASIKNASVHTLRHTSATNYVARGANIRDVQDMLGHKSLETTQIYVAVVKKRQKEMVQDFAL